MIKKIKNKITEILRTDNNRYKSNIQLTINNNIIIIFKYYYNSDTPNIIYNELIHEKIFLDYNELMFFLNPFSKYNSRYIRIKNI